MTERDFLQQLFLLKCDIEACPMLDAFAAQQRERWAARLGDLLNRRTAAGGIHEHTATVQSETPASCAADPPLEPAGDRGDSTGGAPTVGAVQTDAEVGGLVRGPALDLTSEELDQWTLVRAALAQGYACIAVGRSTLEKFDAELRRRRPGAPTVRTSPGVEE